MQIFMIKSCLAALVGLTLLHTAPAGERGAINDPDGFTNVRAGQSTDSAVVAKVKAGEAFEFESGEGSEWWKVTLASGKTGWMHFSRIQFHHTLDEIPEKDEEDSEVAYLGKEKGFDYCVTARAAAKGDPAAMKLYFGINDADGGAAEMHSVYFNRVIHLVGDEKLAAFLKGQALDFRLDVRHELTGGMVLWPFEVNRYTERIFPKTYALLCRKEIVDWPSPDGRFVIRKVFDDARVTENSKVEKAELIEKAGGKVVADLTGDDIGAGLDREGSVMWAPDSNRFAYFSGARLGGEAQTAIFQETGGKFASVELPDVTLPGRAGDAELKGAELIWRFVEPVRWEKADVLVLLHHEYFEGKRANRSIRNLGRTYEITHDLTKGTSTARVKKFGE